MGLAEVSAWVMVRAVGMNVFRVRGGWGILPRKPQELTSERKRRPALRE